MNMFFGVVMGQTVLFFASSACQSVQHEALEHGRWQILFQKQEVGFVELGFRMKFLEFLHFFRWHSRDLTTGHSLLDVVFSSFYSMASSYMVVPIVLYSKMVFGLGEFREVLPDAEGSYLMVAYCSSLPRNLKALHHHSASERVELGNRLQRTLDFIIFHSN